MPMAVDGGRWRPRRPAGFAKVSSLAVGTVEKCQDDNLSNDHRNPGR